MERVHRATEVDIVLCCLVKCYHCAYHSTDGCWDTADDDDDDAGGGGGAGRVGKTPGIFLQS